MHSAALTTQLREVKSLADAARAIQKRAFLLFWGNLDRFLPGTRIGVIGCPG